jgi:hypothetical protein
LTKVCLHDYAEKCVKIFSREGLTAAENSAIMGVRRGERGKE